MIYSNPENWEHPIFLRSPGFLAMSDEERTALCEQSDALHQEIAESGELLVAAALADPLLTRSVRVRDGVAATIDGPYVEAKEQLAGYLVVDCDGPERVAQIAARIPDAQFGGVEVHPIMDMSGQEM
jgi:hypothetical protein